MPRVTRIPIEQVRVVRCPKLGSTVRVEDEVFNRLSCTHCDERERITLRSVHCLHKERRLTVTLRT